MRGAEVPVAGLDIVVNVRSNNPACDQSLIQFRRFKLSGETCHSIVAQGF